MPNLKNDEDVKPEDNGWSVDQSDDSIVKWSDKRIINLLKYQNSENFTMVQRWSKDSSVTMV